MPADVRPLTAEDHEQSLALGREAFGTPPAGTPTPSAAAFPLPGRRSFGAVEDGRLVARVVGREYASWFHGREVATCGVAGVTVQAEHRGTGLLADLFAAVLGDARERGQVVSTLFPTAPGIYRRLGYEIITALDTVEVPTSELAAVRAPSGVRTRRAEPADVPAVRRAYDAWAALQNGPLTRRGASFPETDEEVLAEVTGTTVAVDEDGAVVGYASWDRGQGHGAGARLEVHDLVGLSPEAHRALWRVLGSFASVTPATRWQTSGDDVARLVLPGGGWERVETRPYMLRVHDVAGALTGVPAGLDADDLDLRVAGDPLGVLDGGYRLRLRGPATACAPADVGAGATALTPQGLALLWSGAQSCGNLRLAGHLRGGSPGADAVLDRLLGGRQVHVRDYF